MRLPFRALLAILVFASPALPATVHVDVSGPSPDGRFAVSWALPSGFDESELLVEVDGGPRVRLTDELRVARPSVLVEVPALAGTARFVVRAGGAGLGERDVAFSERFRIDGLALSGRAPVLLPASRSNRAAGTEWWADRPAAVAPFSSSGLSAPGAREVDEPAPVLALPVPRAGEGPGSAAVSLLPRRRGASPPAPLPASLRAEAFRGAAVPLRN